ncbi:glycosyltransferase family 2 protein [Faecalibacter sp. LW9]|uniref:glycosyltransferase family 2 protein n=1 Tax=Faecalibacter sp. LW9 TaxID=3103144 RepID=UPI002AFE4A63|nr:glycosyltransferase [Faecalibacter sp. LW9]
MNNKIVVSISCITYNHVKYIRQCLDGFLMQECDFEFEVLIHDDASTDGTQEIIKEYVDKYPEIIKPIYQTQNQYSQGVRGMNAKYNFPRAQGKYIALCEGDDYWTDPLKLQKQVDFLEENEEFSLVCGGFNDNGENKLFGEDIIFTINNFHEKWFVKLLTLMFRNNNFDYNKLTQYKYSRDVHLIYFLLKLGKGYYFNETFGSYNRHSGGVFSNLKYSENLNIQYKVYRELYDSDQNAVSKKLLFDATIYYGKVNFKYILKSFKYINSINDFKTSIYCFFFYKKYVSN